MSFEQQFVNKDQETQSWTKYLLEFAAGKLSQNNPELSKEYQTYLLQKISWLSEVSEDENLGRLKTILSQGDDFTYSEDEEFLLRNVMNSLYLDSIQDLRRIFLQGESMFSVLSSKGEKDVTFNERTGEGGKAEMLAIIAALKNTEDIAKTIEPNNKNLICIWGNTRRSLENALKN